MVTNCYLYKMLKCCLREVNNMFLVYEDQPSVTLTADTVMILFYSSSTWSVWLSVYKKRQLNKSQFIVPDTASSPAFRGMCAAFWLSLDIIYLEPTDTNAVFCPDENVSPYLLYVDSEQFLPVSCGTIVLHKQMALNNNIMIDGSMCFIFQL